MKTLPLQNDTIIAVATPPGEGGIGVLRLSGPKAPEALKSIWRGQQSVDRFTSHRLYFGHFFEPNTELCLDKGLAVWMRAPSSYTGEDVVEIQVHGGPLLLHRFLEVLVAWGLRPAAPGEFTRRAFLNGKIDLLQAEAVGALIHAQSEAALHNAQRQLEGRLSQEIKKLRGQCIDLLARVEAAIDFPEEDIEIIAPQQTQTQIEQITRVLRAWLEKFQVGRLLREGVRLALVGRPNVGKSSLLNRLLGEDRAIVHDSPGTTRDVIEAWVHWDGIAYQIFDTAGLREGEEAVEQEGIRRSKLKAESADLILWLIDAAEGWTEADREVAQTLQGRVLLVANKTDKLPTDLGLSELELGFSKGEFSNDLPSHWTLAAPSPLGVSAVQGTGLEKLKQSIGVAVGVTQVREQNHAYLNNVRHQRALQQALVSLKRAHQALEGGLPAECVAADLREVAHFLGELIGEISTEDILDKIFQEFCLGK